MKFIKRLLFVFGFIPMFLFSVIRWIFTGNDPMPFMDKFIDYTTKIK